MLELVLVLLVIALLLALAAPSLRGWGRGSRLRDAADDVLAAAAWGRSQAVATATTHRLEIDPGQGTFTVTAESAAEPGTFAPAVGEYGFTRSLPAGVRIDVSRGDGGTSGVIEFSPTGRGTPVRITVSDDAGDAIVLESLSPAEPLARLRAGEAQ